MTGVGAVTGLAVAAGGEAGAGAFGECAHAPANVEKLKMTINFVRIGDPFKKMGP